MKTKYVVILLLFVGLIVGLFLTLRHEVRRGTPGSRAIDTVNVGAAVNDGTGDPLRTAFIKVNRLIVMADSLDLDSLTHDEMMALKDIEDVEDAVLFYVGDTTVTAEIGKVVFKTSDAHFYGCVKTSGKKWEAFN